jgi:drug/metabolite transporter (DMT)-like permease
MPGPSDQLVRARPARLHENWATLAGVAAILLWAGLALLTVRARGIPSFELLALTFAVAFLAGLAMLALRGRAALRQMVQPAAPWLTAFCGIFLFHALYFHALSAAPPAQASLIAYLWPLLVVLLSAVGGGVILRPAHVVGALLGLAGTAIILLGGGADAAFAPGAVFGYLAAFSCAFVWAAYSVRNRRFAETPSGMIVGVCGAVALAGGLVHAVVETTIRPDATQWAAIVALGIGPTGLAFLAWDHATKHGRLPLLGALSYLAPLVSTLLLVVTGAAAATGQLMIAALLILGGALLAAAPR